MIGRYFESFSFQLNELVISNWTYLGLIAIVPKKVKLNNWMNRKKYVMFEFHFSNFNLYYNLLFNTFVLLMKHVFIEYTNICMLYEIYFLCVNNKRLQRLTSNYIRLWPFLMRLEQYISTRPQFLLWVHP